MTRIALTALEVVNCGPWQGRHRFEFPPSGLAVYCAPNETGKTTLLRLVAAVLWGYDPPAQNWFVTSDDGYQAALEYLRTGPIQRRDQSMPLQDELFRVERHFRTGHVQLKRQKKGGWDPLQESRHGPRSRTADAEQWRELLQVYFAPISPEGFTRLAMLSPPFLPEPKDHGDLIQSLIAGAGENTKSQAQSELLQRHRNITKRSRDAGIANADARNPGELDLLREQRSDSEKKLGEAERALESGLRIREEIQQLERKISETDSARLELTRQLDVLDRLRALRREREDKEQIRKGLENTVQEWERLKNEEKQLSAEGQQFPPGLQGLATETRETREQWVTLLTQYRDQCRSFREKLAEIERFADVSHWPEDAPEQVEALEQHLQRYREIEDRLRLARARLRQMQPVIDRGRQIRAGVGLAAAVGLLVAIILSLAVSPLLGVVAGLLAAGAASGIALLLYRPTCWPPEYTTWQQEVANLESQLTSLQGAIDQQKNAILAWAGTRELKQLHQGVGRFQTFQEAKKKFQEDQKKLLKIQRELARMPEVVRQLANISSPARDEVPPVLEESHIERITEVLELLKRFDQWTRKKEQLHEAQELLFRSEGVHNGGELAEKCDKAQQEFDALLLEERQFLRESPLAEEAQRWSGEQLEREVTRLREELNRTERTLEELRAQRNDRERELARWEGQNILNVAQSREQLTFIKDKIRLLESRAWAIAQASQLIEEAYRLYTVRHREAIQEGVNQLMARWTGFEGREFCVDDQFIITFQVKGSLLPDETLRNWSELSQGTQDQLALAIRWAVLDRLAGDVILPLLLDDCFHMWDENRRLNFQAFLAAHPERQIILVTHDKSFLSWGQPIVHHPLDS